MTTFTELTQEYICKEADLLSAITEPLHRFFGSTYATYHRIDNTGNYTCLVDRPDWAEYYVGGDLFQIDPYLCHPDNYETGTTLWDMPALEFEGKMMNEIAQEKFRIDHGIMLIQRSENAVEMFGIGSPSRELKTFNLYQNNLSLIRAFISHFKAETNHLLSAQNTSPVALNEIKQEKFFDASALTTLEQKCSSEELLIAIGYEKELRVATTLTPREKQVIKLLCEGHSAIATAKILCLSPRTVEHYLENAKDKAGALSRPELLTLGRLLVELNLL